MVKIHIGEIRVRFRGISEQKARGSLYGIENEVISLIGRSLHFTRCDGGNVSFVEDIDAGAVECGKGATDEEIRAVVASRIAGIVRGRIT